MDRRDIPGVVQGYAPQSHQLFGIPEQVLENGVFVFHPSIEWTGGGLVSNSSDLAHWAKALYEGRAIGADALNEMLTSITGADVEKDALGRMLGYGLGVSVVKSDAGTYYRHGGFFPGYNSFLGYFPDEQVAIAMQINTDSSEIETHFNTIVKIVLDELETH
jgi:D-alanyl-D-alanine carboxypeptidase